MTTTSRVITKSTELIAVGCPHCKIGTAQVPVTRYADGAVDFDTKPKFQCGSCNQYFKVRPQLQLVGYC